MANKLIWHSTKPHKTAHGSIQNMLGFGKVNQEISLLHAPQKRRHRCNHLRQARILGLRYHSPPMPEDGLQNCAMRRWSRTISTPRHYHHWSRYVEYGGCGRRSCWGGLAWCVWHPSWAPCSCSRHPSIPEPRSLPAASRTSPSLSPKLMNVNVDDEEISESAPQCQVLNYDCYKILRLRSRMWIALTTKAVPNRLVEEQQIDDNINVPRVVDVYRCISTQYNTQSPNPAPNSSASHTSISSWSPKRIKKY